MASPFVVSYSGVKFDIGEFLGSHPAGAKIIEPYKDKDITQAFDEVGHSKSALKIMNKYKITNEEIKIETKNTATIASKLITREDPYHFHKVFGLFALGSFVYRYLYVLPTTGGLGFTGSFFDILTLCSHWMLSSSSLIFHVLDKRIVERPLIIYEEYRLHAIVFTTRAVGISLFGIYTTELDENTRRWALGGMLVSLHLLVDWITRKYGTVGVTAVRNNNDGDYKYIRLFYSFYQICALGSHIIVDKNLCDLGYNALVAIQSSTFLMTLKRKSIIRWKSHMFWYSFALLLSYSVIWRTKGWQFFIQMAVVFFFRVNFNMNKYLLWTAYAATVYTNFELTSLE
jgi:hypothetical protein